MVHLVKELLHVNVHHLPVSCLDVSLRRFHRLMCASSRSESVAMVTKRFLELWTEYLMHRLLDEPIQYRRYP